MAEKPVILPEKHIGFLGPLWHQHRCVESVCSGALSDWREAPPAVAPPPPLCLSIIRPLALLLLIPAGFTFSCSFKTRAPWTDSIGSHASDTRGEPAKCQHWESVPTDAGTSALAVQTLQAVVVTPASNTASWRVLVAFTQTRRRIMPPSTPTRARRQRSGDPDKSTFNEDSKT